MATVADKQAHTATAFTDQSTCETTVKAGTACLEWLLRMHEQIHREKCISFKGINKPLTLQMYLDNVLTAYRLEMLEIRRLLTSMPASCRPAGWVGTITVTETKGVVITNNIPGTSTYDKGAVETMDHETIRTGTIRFDGRTQDLPSTWQVTGRLIKTWVHNGMVDCDTTPLREDLYPVKSETRTEINLSGSKSTSIQLDFSVFLVDAEISLRLPAVDLVGNGSTVNTVTGGCPGMARNDKDPIANSESDIGPDDVQFKSGIGQPFEFAGGKIHRARGSYLYHPGPIAQRDPPGVRSTHSIRVTWNLFAFGNRMPTLHWT
jgi:hypothetical protein